MLLAITLKPTDAEREIVSEVVDDIAEASYLSDFDESGRRDILSRADVVLARNTGKELRPEDLQLVSKAPPNPIPECRPRPYSAFQLPWNVPIGKNAGASADLIAEHMLAMALAAAKRLMIEHRNLSHSEFNQFTPNKLLRERICGIFRFGQNWHCDRAPDAVHGHAHPRD